MKNEEIIERLISWGWVYEEIHNPNTQKDETIMRDNWKYYTVEEAIEWYKKYMGLEE